MTYDTEVIIASDFLIEVIGVEECIIDCLLAINGWSMKTMEDILYWATGYTSFDQCDEWSSFYSENV